MELKILHADGSLEAGEFELGQTSDRPPNCRLTFRSPRREASTFENSDFFECLVDFRRVIEGEGGKVLCHGARRDVFPSPMQRRTAGGLKAYHQRLGEKALEQDQVDTFAETEAALVGTVDEQRAYNETWLRSLGWEQSGGKWYMTDASKTPTPGEIEEAKRFPNGSVSRIASGFDPDGAVPIEAIEGAWPVDGEGRIAGKFLKNPRYDPKLGQGDAKKH
ncbi:MAG: hypothetical protein AAGA21_02865 [Pseudomonadota bacterium]